MSLYQPKKKQKQRVLMVLAGVLVAIIGFIYSQKNTSTTVSQQGDTVGVQGKKPIVIAYQTGVDPTKLAQANHDYEHKMGRAIIWKKFDSGADVLTALAAGDVDIGNIGSSPFTIATSQGLPIEAFYIASVLGTSEALVVRPSIKTAQDLLGKKIAVPFTSTTHYSLLSALKHWQIAKENTKLVNLRPPEIMAAWERGDIDAAYVWEPALSKLKATGHVLVSNEDVGKWGAPTYDLWVARSTFAKENPQVLAQFVAVSNQVIATFNHQPKAILGNAESMAKIATLTGSKAEEVAQLLPSNHYPNLAEQKQILSTRFANDIEHTARFLHEQGSVDNIQKSYQQVVNVIAIETILEP